MPLWWWPELPRQKCVVGGKLACLDSGQDAHTTSHCDSLRTLQLLTFVPDYTLNNPDTLTKYKTAGQISEKVLAEVSKLCVPGAKIVEICQKGDKLIEEEVAKVYRGKKITKGMWPMYGVSSV